MNSETATHEEGPSVPPTTQDHTDNGSVDDQSADESERNWLSRVDGRVLIASLHTASCKNFMGTIDPDTCNHKKGETLTPFSVAGARMLFPVIPDNGHDIENQVFVVPDPTYARTKSTQRRCYPVHHGDSEAFAVDDQVFTLDGHASLEKSDSVPQQIYPSDGGPEIGNTERSVKHQELEWRRATICPASEFTFRGYRERQRPRMSIIQPPFTALR